MTGFHKEAVLAAIIQTWEVSQRIKREPQSKPSIILSHTFCFLSLLESKHDIGCFYLI